MSKQPRGIRNHNPGNIEWGDPWQGLVPHEQRTDKRFCQFSSAAFGIRALARVLITYQDKRRAKDGSKIDSIQEIVERWAPPVENNTQAYVSMVAKAVGIEPTLEEVNLHDYHTMRTVAEAIIRHENGKGPLNTPNTWYDSATIDRGLELAGVIKPVKSVRNVPVTKETVGATATAGVGITQIADVAPSVVTAINSSQDHLTSGQFSRIVIGLVLVGIAGFIAYSQIKKHDLGTE